MKIHRLHQEQTIRLGIEEAWAFFSDPRNLEEITPPDMKFRITSESIPKLFDGQIITYRIQLAPLIWKTWVTEIKAVEPGRSFIDEQRFGPYRFWHHRHELIPVSDSETKMIDEIQYLIGFGPFGNLAHRLFVGEKLKSIFDFRREKLDEMFNHATNSMGGNSETDVAIPNSKPASQQAGV